MRDPPVRAICPSVAHDRGACALRRRGRNYDPSRGSGPTGCGRANRRGKRLNATTPNRLVIADDHPLFRGALREAISGLFPDADIAEAGSFDETIGLIDRGGVVDLVLLDLAMPGVRGFSGLMYLRAQYPSVPV